MNQALSSLHPYPFEKLRKLLLGSDPMQCDEIIDLSIGEPKHATPEFLLQSLRDNGHLINQYPTTAGLPTLRETFANWISHRFPHLSGHINTTHVLPVNGTREALFAIAQTVIDARSGACVLMPNPFYQIYEGAALLAGAQPEYIDFSVHDKSVPALAEITEETWQKCRVLYLCSPSNPSGEIIPQNVFQELIQLAIRHDFFLISDECYSEIYFDEDHPPNGLLHACHTIGNDNFKNCLAFYSLSKRSNAPGLRSGFVAGDASLIAAFLQYRTYHGCAMPLPTQHASIAAWQDEQHVIDNRQQYREKFHNAKKHLDTIQHYTIPAGGFYIWLPTPIPDDEFALRLYREYAVKVLPGSYLSRSHQNKDPGANHVRIALVANAQECNNGVQRIVELAKTL